MRMMTAQERLRDSAMMGARALRDDLRTRQAAMRDAEIVRHRSEIARRVCIARRHNWLALAYHPRRSASPAPAEVVG